jgi:hypothetical protein
MCRIRTAFTGDGAVCIACDRLGSPDAVTLARPLVILNPSSI